MRDEYDFSQSVPNPYTKPGQPIAMSLTDLMPMVESLSQSDKVALFKRLSTQIPNPDLQAILTADEYPIISPYNSFEAATILMQAIRDDEAQSAHEL
jgi:hypothetical protein